MSAEARIIRSSPGAQNRLRGLIGRPGTAAVPTIVGEVEFAQTELDAPKQEAVRKALAGSDFDGAALEAEIAKRRAEVDRLAQSRRTAETEIEPKVEMSYIGG